MSDLPNDAAAPGSAAVTPSREGVIEQIIGPPVVDRQATAIRQANRGKVENRFDHKKATDTVTFGKGVPNVRKN